MTLRIILMFIVSGFAKAIYASSIDLNANNDTVRFTYAKATSHNVVTDVGILFLDKKKNDSELGLHAGINLVSGSFRFGIRTLYVSPGPYDALSVGAGIQLRTAINKQVGLGGHFYYAPDATSFMDSTGYREYAIRLNLNVSKNLYFYLGYRDLKVKILDKKNNVELDDGFHIGFKLYF